MWIRVDRHLLILEVRVEEVSQRSLSKNLVWAVSQLAAAAEQQPVAELRGAVLGRRRGVLDAARGARTEAQVRVSAEALCRPRGRQGPAASIAALILCQPLLMRKGDDDTSVTH